MEEELLSVVDACDRVEGILSRGEIHRRGLRHRAVHILVFNHRNQILLQKRSLSKDNNPGQWDSSAAGHVDAGESYDDCALREIAEELGICLNAPPARLFKLDASPTTGMEFCQVYRMQHEGPFRPAPAEIDQLTWFTTEDIDDWISAGGTGLTPTLVSIWRKFTGA